MPKTKVRKIRATKGAEGVSGTRVKILSLSTQYAVDRFGIYIQRNMRRSQIRAIRRGLPQLGALRDHLRRTQGKDSADFKLVQETVERYVGLYRDLRKMEAPYGRTEPVYDPDIDRRTYG